MTAATSVTSLQARSETAEHTSVADTLAGEHALLLRGVNRRALPVLALLDTRAWPHAELGTLIAFLRNAVLRQVSDEESLMYPHDATAPPFAELSADHVRLHNLTTRLELARAQECDPHELRALIEQLVTTLERHLAAEQAVLAALPDLPSEVPSAAALVAGEQSLLPDTGPVLISLDGLPEERAAEWAVERLLRLSPLQSAQIHSGDAGKLARVRRWLQAFDSARYGVAQGVTGREYTLEVTRRSAG